MSHVTFTIQQVMENWVGVWDSLVPRPPPSFPSLAVRKSGRGPGTFPHVSNVTDRANYVNVGDM